jgi:hypothetical protein
MLKRGTNQKEAVAIGLTAKPPATREPAGLPYRLKQCRRCEQGGANGIVWGLSNRQRRSLAYFLHLPARSNKHTTIRSFGQSGPPHPRADREVFVRDEIGSGTW